MGLNIGDMVSGFKGPTVLFTGLAVTSVNAVRIELKQCVSKLCASQNVSYSRAYSLTRAE